MSSELSDKELFEVTRRINEGGVVDVVYRVFSKSFDEVPCGRKAKRARASEKQEATTNWIQNVAQWQDVVEECFFWIVMLLPVMLLPVMLFCDAVTKLSLLWVYCT